MEDGTLEALRNSNGQFEALTRDDNEPNAIGGAKQKRNTGLLIRPKKSQQSGQAKARRQQDVDDESDGGFFEE